MGDLRSFGEWDLLGSLGEGGFGEVLHWRHRSTGQEIATKRLKENQYRADEVSKLKQRWTQEYEWINNLNTPYIVRGVQIGDADFLRYLNEHHQWKPLPVIVMEYCDGGDLRKQLQKADNMNGLHEFEVREVMKALRHAVEYLHQECKIEHRDLKPDNIVIQHIEGKRCYKLTDFGYARNTSENTILKSVVGTRHYFAPEVVDTSCYTKTVDYWSLGVIAFEMMCGRHPFIPHSGLYNIILNIKKKPYNCIAITEMIDQKESYRFHSKMFAEHRLTHRFVARMEQWLRLALDVNHRTRGTVAGPGAGAAAGKGAADEVQGRSSSVPQIFTELDAILDTKILTVFCLNTYEFLDYEVTPSLKMSEFLGDVVRDTGLVRDRLFFSLPPLHPKEHLANIRSPIDFYVAEWSDTSEAFNPPVMLYIVDYRQCARDIAPPHTSETIRKCMQMDADKATLPDWLLQLCEQHTHYILANEQRHLEALLSGLKQYAISVEDELYRFDESLRRLQDETLSFLGVAGQFHVMVDEARKAHERESSSSCSDFYQEWYGKADKFKQKSIQVHVDIGQNVRNRYKSALRRCKEEATSQYYDVLIGKDIYELAYFRKYLEEDRRLEDSKTRLRICQKAFDNCIEKRQRFFANSQVQQTKEKLRDILEEFFRMRVIVDKTRAYLASLNENLTQETGQFYGELFKELNVVKLNRKLATLTVDSSNSMPAAMNDGSLVSFNNLFELKTGELIQDSEQLMAMARSSMDVDEPATNIPTTIDFD